MNILWAEASTYNGDIILFTLHLEECVMEASCRARNFYKISNNLIKLVTSQWSLLFSFCVDLECSKKDGLQEDTFAALLGSRNSNIVKLDFGKRETKRVFAEKERWK